MRKLMISVLAGSLTVAGASAQVKAYKPSKPMEGNTVAYALPRSVVRVQVVAERESVRVGPYARFAQKLLGVMAPLADKDIYTIQSATLCAAQEADPAEVYALDNPDKSPLRIYDVTPEGFVAASAAGQKPLPPAWDCAGPLRGLVPDRCEAVSYLDSDTSFVKVSVDRLSLVEKSPESMAQDAANAIFSLRRHRIDLVTGEAGENVFGAGLKAALEEIDRLEQEYLSLFLGKQFRQRIVREFSVVPSKDEAGDGRLPFLDRYRRLAVRGRSVGGAARPAGACCPENKAQSLAPERRASKDSRGTILYRVADMVNCRLMDGNREIAQSRLPLYQFGQVIELPVTSVK